MKDKSSYEMVYVIIDMKIFQDRWITILFRYAYKKCAYTVDFSYILKKSNN